MHCIHCGAEIPDYAKFCTACGKPVQAAPVEAEQPAAFEPAEDAQESGDTCSSPDTASEGYKAANAQLPASYSNPNYSSQAKTSAAAPSNTNALAIAGFVCSLIFLPIGVGILTSIAGFVMSLLGMNAAKTLPGKKGHGLALAGTIISAVRIALILIGFIALIALMFRGVGRVGHEVITNWQDYVPYYH